MQTSAVHFFDCTVATLEGKCSVIKVSVCQCSGAPRSSRLQTLRVHLLHLILRVHHAPLESFQYFIWHRQMMEEGL
jgi:hypothetical protein